MPRAVEPIQVPATAHPSRASEDEDERSRKLAARFVRPAPDPVRSSERSAKNGLALYSVALALAVTGGVGCAVYLAGGEDGSSWQIAPDARAAVAPATKIDTAVIAEPDRKLSLSGPVQDDGETAAETGAGSWAQTLETVKELSSEKSRQAAGPASARAGGPSVEDYLNALKTAQKSVQ